MRLRRKALAIVAIVAVVAVVVVAMPLRTTAPIVTPADAPARDVAVVLGCGPGTLLAQRMDAACALIESKRAQRLLLSGMKNEMPYMTERAKSCGADILVDDAATRTLENLRRGRDLFGVKSALVVTQRYHIERALYLAHALGIDAVGVVASGEPADPMQLVRERFARLRAILDVALL
jgi:SanA protein